MSMVAGTWENDLGGRSLCSLWLGLEFPVVMPVDFPAPLKDSFQLFFALCFGLVRCLTARGRMGLIDDTVRKLHAAACFKR